MSTQATKTQSEASKQPNLTNLDFIRITIAQGVRLIPSELIESVKGILFTPEQFYQRQEAHMNAGNPGNLLFALVTKDDMKVHGYLWAEINQLDKTLFINTFSVSKEYWGKGLIMNNVVSFLDKLKHKHNCPRVFWITTNDKFFVKHGFKRSKNVLMEYNLS